MCQVLTNGPQVWLLRTKASAHGGDTRRQTEARPSRDRAAAEFFPESRWTNNNAENNSNDLPWPPRNLEGEKNPTQAWQQGLWTRHSPVTKVLRNGEGAVHTGQWEGTQSSNAWMVLSSQRLLDQWAQAQKHSLYRTQVPWQKGFKKKIRVKEHTIYKEVGVRGAHLQIATSQELIKLKYRSAGIL